MAEPSIAAALRVAVVGVGHVGSAFAFALIRSGLVSELALVDFDSARAAGEAMDLSHAVPFGRPVRVTSGGLEECAGAEVVVITAGAAQLPGETRLDLAARNVALFRRIVPEIVMRAPNAVVLIATNPVDVMTMAAISISGLPASRVLGSGTVLDTARLRFLLSQRFDVDARSVHAYVVGEHGDSEVVAWSTASIAGMPLDAFDPKGAFDELEREAMARATRQAAYEIIAGKGYTGFGIAAGLVRPRRGHPSRRALGALGQFAA